ncbi:uncharacterized protein LOC144444722 [Glandiceps talaboti]
MRRQGRRCGKNNPGRSNSARGKMYEGKVGKRLLSSYEPGRFQLYSQPRLQSGRRPDFLVVNRRTNTSSVIEAKNYKKSKITTAAVKQVRRYMRETRSVVGAIVSPRSKVTKPARQLGKMFNIKFR